MNNDALEFITIILLLYYITIILLLLLYIKLNLCIKFKKILNLLRSITFLYPFNLPKFLPK